MSIGKRRSNIVVNSAWHATSCLLVLLLVAGDGALSSKSAIASESESIKPTAADIAKLNTECRERLGVSFIDLSLLVEAGPGEWFTPKALKREGRLSSVDRLVSAGYVTAKPASANGQEWLEIVPTKLGDLVLAELRKGN
jgi:hypothetical protein